MMDNMDFLEFVNRDVNNVKPIYTYDDINIFVIDLFSKITLVDTLVIHNDIIFFDDGTTIYTYTTHIQINGYKCELSLTIENLGYDNGFYELLLWIDKKDYNYIELGQYSHDNIHNFDYVLLCEKFKSHMGLDKNDFIMIS